MFSMENEADEGKCSEWRIKRMKTNVQNGEWSGWRQMFRMKNEPDEDKCPEWRMKNEEWSGWRQMFRMENEEWRMKRMKTNVQNEEWRIKIDPDVYSYLYGIHLLCIIVNKRTICVYIIRCVSLLIILVGAGCFTSWCLVYKRLFLCICLYQTNKT